MIKKLLLYLSVAAIMFATSCSKDNGGGKEPPIIDDGKEVSLYQARKWDGQKRAGIFYEIFVRSFADSDGDGIGDLNGITQKLDYLSDMGIGGIWLTPINPMSSYHGYDVENYTDVDPDFGTLADFDALVAKAHSLNIKIVLDFVINHTSKFHPWFLDACKSETSKYRDYFLFSKDPAADIAAGRIPMTDTYNSGQWHNIESGTGGYRYMGMFSSWMPEINYDKVEACENSVAFKAICDAGRFWLARGTDGFRLDAVKHIYQSETSDENPEFLRKFYEELKKSKSDLYMIGEVLSGSDVVAPYYKGLPALFEFQGWWDMTYAINNQHAKWFPKDILNYEKKYSLYRTDFIQATKLSNHDEDRTRSSLGGDIKKAKIAGAILLTVSGSPYIYYGEELGMLGTKSQGDENVRDPFLWSDASGDKYRPTWRYSTFSNDYTVGNLARQEASSTSIYRLYEKFSQLRNTYPALAQGRMELPSDFNDADNTNKNFMVFYRQHGSERLLVVHNVSAEAKTFTINEAVTPIADFGGVVVTKVSNSKYTAIMPAYTSLVCECN